MGTILSTWMSSSIIISLLRLANPRVFINFLQGVSSVGWLGPFLRLIGGGRWSSSLSQGFGQETLLKLEGTLFPPYTDEMSHLCPEGMSFPTPCITSLYHIYLPFFFFFFFFLAMRRPSLSKFSLDRVQQACSFADRTFHSLVTICRLASWGLGPEPTEEALAHKLTTRRRKLSLLSLS